MVVATVLLPDPLQKSVLLTVVVTTTRKKWIGREKEKESKYNK